MAEFISPAGIRIAIPDTFRIEPQAVRPRGRAPGGLPKGPIPMPMAAGAGDGGDPLVAALTRHGFDLFDVVDLQPTVEGTPLPGQTRRSPTPLPASETATLDMDVADGEQAVVLIEQDGVYAWSLPENVEAAQTPARRGAGATPAAKHLRFRIEVHAQPPGGAATRTGLLGRLVFGRVKAFVLKYAAHLIVEQGVEYLERDSREQLMLVDSLDPAAWRAADDPEATQLPGDRPAKVLLLVHGTFSSTIGTFGGLAATPWGQLFIQAIRSNYDAVLGFDHFTLKRDPAANARTLRDQLERIPWPVPPHIDAVAFSRGGLVLRSLMDNLPTGADATMQVRRAIFVACTNSGTLLADADNWRTLIDLYSNLAIAACRLMQMLPHAIAVATILKELVQGLASLVKYMAATAADGDTVPGLSSMQPGGPFLASLRRGSSGLAEALNYVITSEFIPRLTGESAEPQELPRRLLATIAEGLITQLMHEGNDLVVNASSMAAIDPSTPQLIHDRYDFGQTAKVYHTTYFLRPEVVKALTGWLALVSPAELPAGDSRKRGVLRGDGNVIQGTVFPASPTVLLSTSNAAFTLDLPAQIEPRILVTRADAPIGEVVESIRESSPGYVVVKRVFDNQMLHYAIPAEQLLTATAGSSQGISVIDALGLHETGASAERSLTDVGIRGPEPAVVMSEDRVLGVIPSAAGSSSDIVDLANAVVRPSDAAAAAAATRAMPVFSAPRAAATATLYVRAEMDDVVIAGKATSIDVTLSREVIGGGAAPGAGESSGEVVLDRKIAVQVIARANFSIIGQDRYEIDAPAPNQPWTGTFDIKATDAGNGELWIRVTQGQVPCSTVVLNPLITVNKARQGRMVRRGSGAEQVGAPAIDQLLIVEQRNGSEMGLFFQFQSARLGLLNQYQSKPIVGDRQAYVKSLYDKIEQRWVSTKQDARDFTQELRELGADLFTQLFPQELQDLLWGARDQLKSVLVISTEPFIPWELVHVKETSKPLGEDLRFLGQMGVVRWLHQAGYPPLSVRVRPGRARYVIPDYPHPSYALAELKDERQFIEAEFQATAVAPHPADVRKALQNAQSFDLLHFACHGSADPNNIQDAQVMLEGRVEGANLHSRISERHDRGI